MLALYSRHGSFLARLESFAPNPTSAVPAVKAASRGYVSSESSAKDFILTVWNVLNHNLEQTASIVNMFVDLLEEEDKKSDLLGSWRTFAVEVRHSTPYPLRIL
jgi:E3 ubiquitin-protein ligase ZNF598